MTTCTCTCCGVAEVISSVGSTLYIGTGEIHNRKRLEVVTWGGSPALVHAHILVHSYTYTHTSTYLCARTYKMKRFKSILENLRKTGSHPGLNWLKLSVLYHLNYAPPFPTHTQMHGSSCTCIAECKFFSRPLTSKHTHCQFPHPNAHLK